MGLAVGITVGGGLTIYIVQLLLGNVIGGLPAAAVGFAVVAVGLLAVAKVFEISLGLRSAPIRFWIAALLVGLACWYIDIRVVTWIEPPGDTKKLESAVASASVALSLVSIAVLPAIGEELLFRGVLARSLARHHALLAILASAVVFSAYHLEPVQMVGTFPLALALGTLAVRSGSILPGMLAHFLNNATVIALIHLDAPSVANAIDHHPTQLLAIASAMVAGGIALAARRVTT